MVHAGKQRIYLARQDEMVVPSAEVSVHVLVIISRVILA